MNTEQLTKLASFAGKSANDFWMATGKKPTDVIAELAAALIEANGKVRALTLENEEMRKIIDAVTDLDNEPQYHEEDMCCGGITDAYEAARYGWDAAMERIYGEVIPCAEELSFPATAAAVAQIEAQARIQGINFAASRLCAAYMAGFIDKPVPEVVDVVRMILSAKDEVASNPAPEGLSGEYAEKTLSEMEAFAAELREGK